MKNGFTLIELLAILVLLGVIVLVSVPSIVSTNKRSQEQNYERYVDNIENAAEIYVETHSDRAEYATLKTTNGRSVTIHTDVLVASGVILGTLRNPITDRPLIEEGGSVTVKNENGTLKYTYSS